MPKFANTPTTTHRALVHSFIGAITQLRGTLAKAWTVLIIRAAPKARSCQATIGDTKGRLAVIGATLPLWFASLAAAQPAPTIIDLGLLPDASDSQAWGVSDDGSVVTGVSGTSGNGRAFRWTAASGMVSLGVLPGYGQSFGADVSGDGSTIVGSSGNSAIVGHGFRWTAAGGLVDLGVLSPPGGTTSSFGVSQDGSIAVGVDGTGLPSDRAVLWRSGGAGPQELGVLASAGLNASSGARAVSANGLVVVGASGGNSFGGWAHPFRWTSAGMVDLGLVDGAYHGEALGISADGSTVVGWLRTGNGTRAFRWTAATGMQVIASDAFGYVVALATNGDGSAVVGAGPGEYAFLWTPTLGRVDLRTYLASLGTNVSDWHFATANDMTPDGTTIAGWGTRAGVSGQRAFLIRGLRTRPCHSDFNGDGFLDFFDADAFVACFEGVECPPGQTADFNGDGFVDFFDADAFVEAFEAGC